MAGQGIERRRILRYIGIASVASTFPGFHRWTFACAHDAQAARQVESPGAAYLPLDPQTPLQRLAYLLRDSQVYRVVTHTALRTRLAATGVPVL